MVKVMLEIGGTIKSFDNAVEMVRMCRHLGADYIKVQCFDADTLLRDKRQTFTYKVKSGETITRPLYDVIKPRCLKKQEWVRLFELVDSYGMKVCATVCEPDYFEMCLDAGVRSFKVSTSDIDYLPLLMYMKDNAYRFDELHLDYGNADPAEIGRLAAMFSSVRTIVHHCPKAYGADAYEQQLYKIKLISRIEGIEHTAFSDHSRSLENSKTAASIAVALGVDYIEKCVSMDSSDDGGPEFLQSLDNREDIKNYLEHIRNSESMMWVGEDEGFDRNKAAENRRGAYAKDDLKKGTVLSYGLFDFRRPLTHSGVSAIDMVQTSKQFRLLRDIKKGELLVYGDIGIER